MPAYIIAQINVINGDVPFSTRRLGAADFNMMMVEGAAP